MQRVMVLLEQLDPIVENKLAGGVAKTQKWNNVKHIERAWVSKKPVEAKLQINPSAAAA